MPRPPSDRPVRIADAVLDIIATSGLHAVTHRNIDAHLGYPQGTTSYYARTRAELITRATELLAERFDEATDLDALDGATTDDEAVALIARMMHRLESSETEQIAHYVLLIDLRHDPDLSRLLGAAAPARRTMHAMTADLIERCGHSDADEHAAGLLALLSGLMLARLTGSTEISVDAAVATYWAGISRSDRPAS